MLAADLFGVAVIIAAAGTALASVIAAVASLVGVRRTGQVQQEVKTMNELTLGQLGASRETRRIEEIPLEQRTAQERRHLAMAELDPHMRGVDKSMQDRKQGGEPGSAKLDTSETE